MTTSRLHVQLLRKRFAHKPKLLHALYTEFARQAEKVPPQMSAAQAAGDLQRLNALAHTLKGNAALIGAVRVQELAAAVERSCAQECTADLDASLENLGLELEKTLSELHDLIFDLTPEHS